MRSLKIFLGFCLLGAALEASTPHPTTITVKYKDQLLPVAKVAGTDPVVLVNGKEKRLRTYNILVPQRTKEFSRGYIQLHDLAIVTLRDESGVSASGRSGRVWVRATLTADREIRGGYILIGLSRGLKDFDGSLIISTEYVVHALPAIEAGKIVSHDLTISQPRLLDGMDAFIQFFDADGREIVTSETKNAWAYYAEVERSQLRAALPAYLKEHTGTDQPVRPAICPKPWLKPGLSLPPDATAILTVSPEGLVTETILQGITDPAVAKAVTDMVSGWLFLPQLERGRPVAVKIQVPVS